MQDTATSLNPLHRQKSRADIGRLNRLDHLRFVAASLVIFWHFSQAAQPDHLYFPLMAILFNGYTGVAMFCTLSGFLFMWIYHDRDLDIRDFVMARALRILPLFVIVFVIAFNISGSDHLADLLAGVLSTLSGSSLPSLISPGWTILVEIQFYALFPLLLILFRKNGLLYLASLFATFVALKCLLWYGGHPSVKGLAYISIIGRIDQFLAGMMAAAILKRIDLTNTITRIILILCGSLGLIAILYTFVYVWSIGGYYGPPDTQISIIWTFLPAIEGICYAAIIAGYLAMPAISGLQARMFDVVFSHGGRVSYSMYLTHLMVLPAAQVIVRDYLDLPLLPYTNWHNVALAMMAVALPLVVAVSTVTYYVIERPMIGLKKSRNNRFTA